MFTFITDGPITCERCHGFFCSFGILHSFVDADSSTSEAKEAYNGTLNRVTCPTCGDTFTYESPLIIYSQKDKFVICSDFCDECIHNGSFETLVKIGGMEDWKFRRCRFSMFGFEKLRIFKNMLDDTVIENIKLTYFDKYKDMDFEYEYIVYNSHDDENFHFSQRDFTGKIIQNLSVPADAYQKAKSFSFCGNWQWANREEAQKYMEETK